MFTMMEEMPTDIVVMAAQLLGKASRVGKSRSVEGAEMFSWIIMMPHERWNIRNEKHPWARVLVVAVQNPGFLSITLAVLERALIRADRSVAEMWERDPV